MNKHFWYLFVWIFAGCVSFTSLTVVVLYAISFGPVKSALWISAYLISLVHRIFILDPVRISLTALWRSYTTKKPPPDYGFHRVLKHSHQHKLQHIKIHLDFLMHRFQKAEWKDDRKQSRKTERLLMHYDSVLNDMLMFAFYIVAVFLVMFGTKDNQSYYSTRFVQDIFTSTRNSGPRFDEILREDDLKNYINQTVAIQLHDNMSHEVKMIGVARLRQHRRQVEHCSSSSILECWTDCCSYFSFSERDMKSYSAEWKPAVSFEYEDKYWRITQPWKYSSSKDSGTFPVLGVSNLYPGGGYIANLGSNKVNSQRILHYLFNSSWIDEWTGVLFVEATFYCANGNIFNLVTVIAERSPFGTYNVQIHVKTAKLLMIHDGQGWTPWLTYATLIVMICMITYRLAKRLIYRESRLHFDVWEYIDGVLVFLSIISVILFVVRNIRVVQLLRYIEDHPRNHFVSFSQAQLFDDLFTWMSAALMCTATMRFWKFLQFNLTFRVLTKALARSAKATIFCLIALIIFEIAISAAFQLINGGNMRRYSTFGKAFITLICFAVQLRENLGIDAMEKSGKSIDIAFYAIQEIAVNIFLLNMVVTIILFHTSELKTEIRNMHRQEYTFWQFLRDKYLDFLEKSSFEIHRGGSVFSKLTNRIDLNDRKKKDEHSTTDYTNEKTTLVSGIINAQMDYLEKYLERSFEDELEPTLDETTARV